MTQRQPTQEATVLSTRPRSWTQVVFRGVAVAAAVLGMGAVAVLAPAASPDRVLAPATKGLYTPVTETARAAYIQNMLSNGYELLAPMTLDEV